MKNIKTWMGAMRAPFLTATIIPVALGSIVAWCDTSSFIWSKFFLVLIGASFLHLGTNLSNDYFDHVWGNDAANKTPTQFSGGSRVIQNGTISPAKVLGFSLVLCGLGSAIGLYLNYLSKGNVILIIGLVGLFLGFFYSVKPLRIGYGGLGEIAVGLAFGPLMVLGAYYVQAQAIAPKALFVSIPVGILIALVLLINEFPDHSADNAVNKKTLVVILGKKKAIAVYHSLLVGSYLSVLCLIVFKFLPPACLIMFLTIPIAIKAFAVSKENFDKVDELLPANASTIGLHAVAGALLCIGLVLGKVWSILKS